MKLSFWNIEKSRDEILFKAEIEEKIAEVDAELESNIHWKIILGERS